MNINEQMSELATSGGLAYAPSDDTIANLLGRTKRARATRQSVATIATTVSALALGIGAAQAYSAAKDDPAFRDRNIINNKDGLTPIELYRAKFGADNPTRTYDSQVDLSSIIEELKAAAQADPKPPDAKNVPPAPADRRGVRAVPRERRARIPMPNARRTTPPSRTSITTAPSSSGW